MKLTILYRLFDVNTQEVYQADGLWQKVDAKPVLFTSRSDALSFKGNVLHINRASVIPDIVFPENS